LSAASALDRRSTLSIAGFESLPPAGLDAPDDDAMTIMAFSSAERKTFFWGQ
jgi:hypothetical protein